MGKIKSAIITAILVAAIVILALFSVISCTVPGSNGVKRYNSFISSIHLGSDFTGEAYTVLYPEGVLSAADYTFGIPDDEDKREEYTENYVQRGSVYLGKELIEDEQAFKESVLSDAEVLAKRLGEKGYTGYSVSVQDDYTIKVSVPTNFTYSAYTQRDTTSRSTETSAITQTLQYLTLDGELSLRNTEVGKANLDYIVTPITADLTTYFSSITKYARAGAYAVKVNLTQTGKAQFKEISNKILDATSDTAIGFYIGDTQLLSLTVSDVIDSSFYISVTSESVAEDYAIVLASVANGEMLANDYNTDTDLQLYYATSALGENAGVYLAVAVLLILVAAIVYSVVRYKKLGLVNALMIAVYALVIVISSMLLEIQLTLAGVFTAVLGLALLCGSNFVLFESVRKETKKGKTIQSAVKSGYKNVLTTILDLHIILVVAALLLALVCAGEIAACGLIFFIATIASYVLYWFTRFMWYVISSPVKDKFGFCGFTREVPIDD